MRAAVAAASLLAAHCLLVFCQRDAVAADPNTVSRGEYVANAADCAGCHTDVDHGGKPYAGGLPLATPFGTFYAPNVTADPETGIGRWTDAQFLHALRNGVQLTEPAPGNTSCEQFLDKMNSGKLDYRRP